MSYRVSQFSRFAVNRSRSRGLGFAVPRRPHDREYFLFFRGSRGLAVFAVPQRPRESLRSRGPRGTAKDFQYFLCGLRGLAGTDRQTFWSVGCRNIGYSVSGNLVYHQHFQFYQITRFFCVENESVWDSTPKCLRVSGWKVKELSILGCLYGIKVWAGEPQPNNKTMILRVSFLKRYKIAPFYLTFLSFFPRKLGAGKKYL